jgi:hypothetical protein
MKSPEASMTRGQLQHQERQWSAGSSVPIGARAESAKSGSIAGGFLACLATWTVAYGLTTLVLRIGS